MHTLYNYFRIVKISEGMAEKLQAVGIFFGVSHYNTLNNTCLRLSNCKTTLVYIYSQCARNQQTQA